MGLRPRNLVALLGPLAPLLLILAAFSAVGSDRAIEALRKDSSLKVRTQAALVLGQRGTPDAVEALCAALAEDDAAAVRIAAAAALGKIGDPATHDALETARRADPDRNVRDAAARALEELSSRGGSRVVWIEEAQGKGGESARAALRASLAKHLARRGFSVVRQGDRAAFRIKPSVLSVDVAESAGKVTIAVKASAVAVDGSGRMAAMIEGGARLKASGGALGAAQQRDLSARALDAAANTLSEDLAARLR